jgi:hypothetical protein
MSGLDSGFKNEAVAILRLEFGFTWRGFSGFGGVNARFSVMRLVQAAIIANREDQR